MGMTYAQASALGIAHLFPAPAGKGKRIPLIVPPAVSAAPADGLNKLERAFWERLQEAERTGHFMEVYEHAMKLRVIGNRWYHPDFMSVGLMGQVDLWETKGFMREDAELKLIAAAERFPCFSWVLVTRKARKWQCQYVTKSGINRREIWCPEWLS